MLSELEKKAADFISANEMFEASSKVLLAVSGGADSTALLNVVSKLNAEKIINVELHCAHINHLLRAEQAKSDEDSVVIQAAGFGLPITTRRINVREFAWEKKLSIETAARQLRIRALIDIAGQEKCNVIATGHQKNDNAETILHRLLRGTGFRGLAGIWPVREFDNKIRFVRPLLGVTREEIVKYLNRNNLRWSQDATNADCSYTRNFIRHRLLPELQEDIAGSLVEQLYELSQSTRRFYKLICSRVDDIWPKVTDWTGEKVILSVKTFLAQAQPIKIELIRRSLATIGCGEGNLTQQHYQKILELAEKKVTGRKIELPGGFMVRSEYGSLSFSQSEVKAVGVEHVIESVELKIPGVTHFGRYFIEAKIVEKCKSHFLVSDFTTVTPLKFTEQFDLDKVKLPLIVRLRQPGDRFIPLGQKGEKKIGKFLTAQKVPSEIRQKILVVTDSEKIIWLWPVRMSEQAKITNKTRTVLQLQITQTL